MLLVTHDLALTGVCIYDFQHLNVKYVIRKYDGDQSERAKKKKNKDQNVICFIDLPYFFAYKTVFFSFQNNPKNLDPSYKMDLDLWDCLGRVKPVLQQN